MDEMDKRACALEDQQERGFWAVIPASVLHDRQLSASAVRLYGEIMLLTREMGFCWASNERLGMAVQASDRTVSRLVTELARAGHVRVQLIKAKDGSSITRKIWPAYLQPAEGVDKNDVGGSQKCLPHGAENGLVSGQSGHAPTSKMSRVDKNGERTSLDNNIYNNIINNTKQLRTTKQDSARAREAVEAYFVAELGDDAEIRQRVKDFLDGREEKRHPMTSLRAAKVAVGKLKRYSAGKDGTVCRAVLLATMDEAIEGCWDSFYPLHEDRRQALLGGGKPEPPAACYPEL